MVNHWESGSLIAVLANIAVNPTEWANRVDHVKRVKVRGKLVTGRVGPVSPCSRLLFLLPLLLCTDSCPPY